MSPSGGSATLGGGALAHVSGGILVVLSGDECSCVKTLVFGAGSLLLEWRIAAKLAAQLLRPAFSRNGLIRSTGNTIVVDCEEPSSSKVCR